MKNYLELVPVSARIRRRQNGMTIICIFLAVFLVSVIFGMADMEIRSQKLQIISQNGEWHMGITGIDDAASRLIAAVPEVKAAGWYSSENGEIGDVTAYGSTVAVIGMDERLMSEVFHIKLLEGSYPRGTSETLITQSMQNDQTLSAGDSVTVQLADGETRELTVAGVCGDFSSLMKMGAYGLILSDEGMIQLFGTDEETVRREFLVQLSEYCDMRRVMQQIRQQFQLTDEQAGENGGLLGVLGQSDDNYMMSLYGTAFVLLILVLAAGVSMIASSLNSNVMQRTQYYGRLRCLGATRKQIMRLVRKEALIWCRTAIPAGILLSMAVIWVLCAVLRHANPGMFGRMPVFAVSLPGTAAGCLAGLLSVLLAARAPARKAAGVSPLTALTGSAVETRPVSSAVNTRLFRVETGLGVHHAVESKKNLALMLCSFALSIILFLCFSVLIDFMDHAVRTIKPWTPDLSVISRDHTCSVPASLLEQLQKNPKVKKVYGRMFAYSIPAVIGGQEWNVNLISYEDQQFTWAEKYLIDGTLPQTQHADSGVLAVYDIQTGLAAGSLVSLLTDQGEIPLTVTGMLSSAPFVQEAGVMNLICSEQTFRQLTQEESYTILDIQLEPGANDADVQTIRKLTDSDMTFSDQRLNNKEINGTYLCFSLFVYGFLVVIAVITVFHTVNSVSMSVSARAKQYGAMRAIGMSGAGLLRMIAAEAAVYGLGGALTGCLAGVMLHRLLYGAMITSRWGDPWVIPFKPLVMITCIVLGTIGLAVLGPCRRLRDMPIVETV